MHDADGRKLEYESKWTLSRWSKDNGGTPRDPGDDEWLDWVVLQEGGHFADYCAATVAAVSDPGPASRSRDTPAGAPSPRVPTSHGSPLAAARARTRQAKLPVTLAALVMAIVPLGGVPTSPSLAAPPYPQAAHRTPDARESYVLPGVCVYPENVEVYAGKYYVGTLCGRMYRGDLREKQAEVFVPRDPDDIRIVGGIEATATRLVVARAGTGEAQVYNRFTGKLVARFYNGHKDKSIVNDVAVTPDGDAYLTEFIRSKLYRLPAKDLRRHRAKVQTLPVFLDFRGTVFPVQEGSANGIVATPDGRFLVVAHYAQKRAVPGQAP